MSHEKIYPLSFHYNTGCLRGILYHPLYTLNNQGVCCSLLRYFQKLLMMDPVFKMIKGLVILINGDWLVGMLGCFDFGGLKHVVFLPLLGDMIQSD